MDRPHEAAADAGERHRPDTAPPDRWQQPARLTNGGIMIVLGVILLIIGFIAGLSVLWTIGLVLLVVGLILWTLGAVGHEVGGRRHYW